MCARGPFTAAHGAQRAASVFCLTVCNSVYVGCAPGALRARVRGSWGVRRRIEEQPMARRDVGAPAATTFARSSTRKAPNPS